MPRLAPHSGRAAHRRPQSPGQGMPPSCPQTPLAPSGLPAKLGTAQGQHLPVLEQDSTLARLDRWAAQAAAVRAGNLRPYSRVGNLIHFRHAQYTPGTGLWAACFQDGTVAVLPSGGTQLNLQAQLSQQTPRVALPRTAEVDKLCCCPAGRVLLVLAKEPGRLLRVSCFRGAQLQAIGTLTESIAVDERCYQMMASADALDVFLVMTQAQQERSRVAAGCAQGITGRHPIVQARRWTPSPDASCLVAVVEASAMLYLCSATSMRAIDLSPLPAPPRAVYCSIWGSLALVWLRTATTAHLIFVDVVLDIVQQQALQFFADWRPNERSGALSQGCRSAALCHDAAAQITVVATTGAGAGKPCFQCPGWQPTWDGIGRHLAVVSPGLRISIFHGISGSMLAFWRVPVTPSPVESQFPLSLTWLPGSAGVLCTHICGIQHQHSAWTQHEARFA